MGTVVNWNRSFSFNIRSTDPSLENYKKKILRLLSPGSLTFSLRKKKTPSKLVAIHIRIAEEARSSLRPNLQHFQG